MASNVAAEGASENGSQVNSLTEGKAKITFTGPSSAFYNPVQEFNRDMTVTVLRQFIEDRREFLEQKKEKGSEPAAKKPKLNTVNDSEGIRVLDALSASGLRALRFSKEIEGIESITANDFSQQAVETIQQNIVVNEVEHLVKPHFGDAIETMMSHRTLDKRFHAVDLDPYGSASIFLDSAVQAVADRGILMVTCTDMAVLCGNTPEACFNKYNSIPLRHKSCHEMALRILLRSIDSHANRYSRYIEPLICISVDFYIRVFVRMHTGAKEAKDSVTKLSNVFACTGCHALHLEPIIKKTVHGTSVRFTPPAAQSGLLGADGKCVHCGHTVHMGGPIYSAPIQNKDFVDRLLQRVKNTPEEERLGTHERNKDFVDRLLQRVKNTPEEERLGTHERVMGILSVISEELHDVPLYYEHDQLMNVVKSPVMRILNIRSAILHAGYRASITHCNAKGLKTDAPVSFLWDIARAVAKQHNVSAERFDETAPGKKILSTESTQEVNFSLHPDAASKSKSENLVRYQYNKGKNWGPKPKAKGSVNSVQAGFQVAS
uniref:tRNA (guanine(26)-N(2))-dimethyltransferase n=1 Tax=Steinernema glaseri TaxID=37863 RepID=A0A1I7Z762_9BILA